MPRENCIIRDVDGSEIYNGWIDVRNVTHSNTGLFVSSSENFQSCSNSNDKNYIHSYNYKPEFKFHKIDNEEELYMGCEIEVDKGGQDNSKAKKILDIIGDDKIYCMTDGSLQSGFEIATHPMTYEYHSTKMNYVGMFDKLIKMGYKAHDTSTCGLHVHFNRSYFGEEKLIQDLCISKLLFIFEKFFNDISLIARRSSTRFASRYYLNDNESILDLYAKANRGNKYRVLNLSNKNTIEVRIFKGTLNYNTFITTLKFVKDVVTIAKNYDIYKLHELNWDYICNYIGDEFTEYYNDRKEKEEEKRKKKEQENEERIRDNYAITSNFHVTPDEMRNAYITIDNRMREAIDFQWSLSESPFQIEDSIEYITQEPRQDLSREEILREGIRRERNPVRKQQLQRELNDLLRGERFSRMR